MKHQKLKIYLLLLMAFSLVCSSMTVVGHSQARFDNTVVVDTFIPQQGQTASSDCLIFGQEQIILLKELPAEGRTVQFTLKAELAIAEPLIWTCEMTDYVSVTVEAVSGDGKLNEEQVLELPAGGEAVIALTLVPTAEALTVPREALTVDVALSFGQLQGTFRTVLAAVEAEEVPTEPATEPEEEPTETENQAPTEPETQPLTEEETEPMEESTEDNTEIETETEVETEESLPDDPQDPGALPEPVVEIAKYEAEKLLSVLNEIGLTGGYGVSAAMEETVPPEDVVQQTEPETAESTEETETTESTEKTETTESTEEPENTEPTEDDETTEPVTEPATEPVTEPELPEENDEGTTIPTQPMLETMEGLDFSGLIPMVIKPSETADSISLGYTRDELTLPLPAFTRYIMDDISYLLYDGGFLELTDVTEIQQILLDLSGTGMDRLTLMVMESLESVLTAGYEVELGLRDEQATSDSPAVLDQPLSEAVTVRDEIEAFTMEFPLSWAGVRELSYVYSLEMLCDMNGTVDFVPLVLEDSVFSARYIEDAEKGIHRLVISFEEELPPAGTYRLTVQWAYQGMSFHTEEQVFYIQYTPSI